MIINLFKSKISLSKIFLFKKLPLFILIISTIFFSGCYSYKEISKQSIVLGAAIDKIEDDYIITMEIIDFSNNADNKDSASSSSFIQSKGKSISEAINSSAHIVGLRTYWNHAKIFILSNKLDGRDLKTVLDFLLRNAETNVNSKLFVAKTEKASDLLKSKPFFHNFFFSSVNATLEANKFISHAFITVLYNVVDTYGYRDSAIALPALDIMEIKKEDVTTSGDDKNDSSSGPNPNDEDTKLLYISGSGIYGKDKFIDFLSNEETMYYLFCIDQISKGVITLKPTSFNEKHDSDLSLSIDIIKSNTKATLTKSNDNTNTFNYDISTFFHLSEVTADVDFFTLSDIALIEKDIETYIKENIENIIFKVRDDLNSDILYWSKLYEAKYQDEFEKTDNLKEAFKGFDFKDNINATIVDTGDIENTIKEDSK